MDPGPRPRHAPRDGQPRVPGWAAPSRRQAAWWLLGASVLLPLGFLVAGVRFHAGDPGVGIFLVAAGGLMLLVAILLTATGTTAALRR